MTLPSSVTAIVYNDARTQILTIQRRDVCIWTLPGGGIEHLESPEIAVVREVLEETGVVVCIKRLVAVYSPINRLSQLTYVFECSVQSGVLATSDETKQVGFFPITKLPQPFFFIHSNWIEDAQKQLSTVIFKKLTEVTYLRFFIYLLSHPIQVIRFVLSRLGFPINSK